MAAITAPTPGEIERVRAWEAEQERLAEERERIRLSHLCLIHGPSPSRNLYGPMPWGYGPGCGKCRREWSRRNGGKPWESSEQTRAREQAEHAAMVADVEAMTPAEFYAEWDALRAVRHKETKPYHWDAKPDEFGVNHFGCATPDGKRYIAMRDRVRREARQFEEAKDVL